jgi:hypothetical protein
MRFFALASLAVSVTLVACVAADGDPEKQSGEAVSASDGGAAATDASATDGSADASAVDAGPAVPTYDQIAPLVANNCAGCHHSALSTVAKLKTNRSTVIQVVSQGRMPKDNPTWNTTSDGQEFLNYMQNSPDMQ